MDWVKEGRIRDNVGQAAGWLILIGAQEYDTVYISGGERRKKTTLTEPSIGGITGWQAGAYEPTTCIHGDIEYLYTLDLKAKTILVQEVVGDGQYRTIDPVTNEPITNEPITNEPISPKTPSRFDGIV
jgi:hypothetical protein